jgi:type III secretion protein R
MDLTNPLSLMLFGVLMGLLPFVLLLTTCFLKVAVVLALVRNALGVQQIPPPMAINGLAIILTIFIMLPVGQDSMNILEAELAPNREMDMQEIFRLTGKASAPLHAFLKRHADPSISGVLTQTARNIWPPRYHDLAEADSWVVLIPSFAITEISRAFELGFLLYLPFICIDLVVSNILLAMGMMMISPMTISLPNTLQLFDSLNGWVKVFTGLMLSYR